MRKESEFFDYKRRYFNEKGLTLVTLVITILVLLVLAGVSVNMLSKENRNI